MSDEFLGLPIKDQADIFRKAEKDTGRSAQVLQKDVWVCWALEQLFTIKTDVKMAFKGGTSLSKVYQVIDRFSEDVDITLDYRNLFPEMNPFEISRNKMNKTVRKELRELVKQHIHGVIFPSLQDSLNEITKGKGKIKGNDEEIYLHYPSGLDVGTGYMEDQIKLEFGGCNAIEPSAPCEIKPDIAEIPFRIPLRFPKATVVVLSPKRTFWEKATLIHVACSRPDKTDPHRISRHWYDLYKLIGHDIGKKALEDLELLRDVVKFKKAFFYYRDANYDACLSGEFRLIPDNDSFFDAIQNDYKKMVDSGMFETTPTVFKNIIGALHKVEAQINKNFTSQGCTKQMSL
ncbi:MAG: nucleotidyl transferase AbiEii/AbiGii toxin family protein [bacterium]